MELNILTDPFLWEKDVKRITHNEHGIDGLGNFSYRNASSAFVPPPMHYHSKYIEIFCMVKGTRFTRIQSGGEIFDYTSYGNEALITYPFELHTNGYEPQAPCEYYAFQLDVSDTSSILGLNRKYSQQLYGMLMSLPCRHVALEKEQILTLKKSFALFSEMTPEASFRGSQVLHCWLSDLFSASPLHEASPKQPEPRIMKAIAYLNDNINEPVKICDLADVTGYSLSHFKTLFKNAVGVTPAEYITMQKIDAAKTRLASGNESITELAYELGFSSSNYFCSVFKKLMGCSPLSYKKRLQEAVSEKD